MFSSKHVHPTNDLPFHPHLPHHPTSRTASRTLCSRFSSPSSLFSRLATFSTLTLASPPENNPPEDHHHCYRKLQRCSYPSTKLTLIIVSCHPRVTRASLQDIHFSPETFFIRSFNYLSSKHLFHLAFIYKYHCNLHHCCYRVNKLKLASKL